MKDLLKLYAGGLIMLLIFWGAMCESKVLEETPCEPVTIHHFANLDSALQFYAPYTNIISDTSIYRTQIAELRAELLAVTVINSKLRMRLTDCAMYKVTLEEQLRYCKCSPHKKTDTTKQK